METPHIPLKLEIQVDNMVDESAELVCKYTGKVEKQGHDHIVKIPETEIEYGSLSSGDIVRISVETTEQTVTESPQTDKSAPSPPVNEGDHLTVEIEDIGDQGDGITRVDRGYVLIVPETEPGDTVEVEVTQTNPNYGFAHLVDKTQNKDEELAV
ncbi:TRAM domain-containing protein [Natrialbaceae archaeon A-CW1-1]